MKRVDVSSNPQSAIRNPQSIRPGIVHRLDRDTSGLIVVAKTAQAHEHLSEQFRAREVFKSYVALVHGRRQGGAREIEEPLGARPAQPHAHGRGARRARGPHPVARAPTLYVAMTLLDVEIKTGRTHQIRVHLAWMKHPVVGDETYGGGRDRNIQDARPCARASRALGRQFLHAARLGFHHPRTGEWMSFTAPLPRRARRNSSTSWKPERHRRERGRPARIERVSAKTRAANNSRLSDC